MTSWNPVTLVRRAARNSPWIVMAVALHLILLAAATIFYTSEHKAEVLPPDIVIQPTPPRAADEKVAELPPEPRKAIPKDAEVELTDIKETYTIDDPDLAVIEKPVGDPNAAADQPPGIESSNTAIGVGTQGTGGHSISPFSKRGGNMPGGPGELGRNPPRDNSAVGVLHGLQWLARHQNEDGSWGALSLAGRCDADHKCADAHKSYVASYDEGLTSMALLAFLGAGFSHESKAFFYDPARDHQKFVTGDVVKNGLKWLVAHENADGSFGKDRPFLYNQALATMAVCEAYGLTQSRYWREPAQRAVDYLEAAQKPSPTGQGLWGWRYSSRQEIERAHQGDSMDDAFKRDLYDSDTSVTGWAVMALKSARMSGLDVKPECFDGALAYVKWVSTADGQAGYLDPKGAGAKVTGPDDQFDYHAAGMSALSMCVRAFTAHDLDDPFLEAAAKRIAADLPRVSKDRLSVDYYYWYYGSLALNQFDGPDSPRKNGKYWKAWNKAMVESVLAEQQTSTADCGFGGWLGPDRWCHAGGPVYATAINVLTLEVYYRYPNAFSVAREAAGKGKPEADRMGVK